MNYILRLFIIFLFLPLMIFSNLIEPDASKNWECTYPNIEGITADLQVTDFGYTFVSGSGQYDWNNQNLQSPTTLVATNQSGLILWNITNEDLIFSSSIKIQ